MLLRNVYVGFTKSGKESLFVKTKVFYDELGKLLDVYIDLKDSTHYNEDEICLSSLVPFSKLVSGKKVMRKKKVIKTYDLDRERIVELKNLFYADVYKKRVGYYQRISAPVLAPCIVESEIDRNVLVERVIGIKAKYQPCYRNLRTGEIYEDEFSCSGYDMPFVTDTRKVEHSQMSEKLSKRKVLEINHKGEKF